MALPLPPPPLPGYIVSRFEPENEANNGTTIYGAGKIWSVQIPLKVLIRSSPYADGVHTHVPIPFLKLDFNGLVRGQRIETGETAFTLEAARSARNSFDGQTAEGILRWPTRAWYQIGLIDLVNPLFPHSFIAPRRNHWSTSLEDHALELTNRFMKDTTASAPFMDGRSVNPYVRPGGADVVDDLTDGTWDCADMCLDQITSVKLGTANSAKNSYFTSFRPHAPLTFELSRLYNPYLNKNRENCLIFYRAMFEYDPVWKPLPSLDDTEKTASEGVLLNHRHIITLNVLINIHEPTSGSSGVARA